MFKSYMILMCSIILFITGAVFNTLIVHAETMHSKQAAPIQVKKVLNDLEKKQEQLPVVDLNEIPGLDLNAAAGNSAPVGEEQNGDLQQQQPQPAIEIHGRSYVNIVINVGKKYIGNSVYVFGGGRNDYDIANGRFDCSAFVHWAFAEAGIEIGHTTDTLKYAGTQIPPSQMQPGDLVFFNTYKQDGHVGIYLGDNKFIGSQCSTGVAIVDMSRGYWKNTFSGRVVRI
jgi:cell wall-associated NlpC family hydrolase